MTKRLFRITLSIVLSVSLVACSLRQKSEEEQLVDEVNLSLLQLLKNSVSHLNTMDSMVADEIEAFNAQKEKEEANADTTFTITPPKIEEKKEKRNIQHFELSTRRGIVKLHTFMHKDSVQLLMGRARTVDIDTKYDGDIEETWKYKGSNEYLDEFTIVFINGELKSVKQYKE